MSRLKLLSTLGAASVLALAAGMANAAPVTVDVVSITSQWTAWTGGSSVKADPKKTEDPTSGTSTLRWGTPSGTTNKSGYDFEASVTPFDATEDEKFLLGEFSHLNWPISSGTGITSATLQVTFQFLLDGETEARTLSSSFLFKHWETPNNSSPCANGGTNNMAGTVNANGCADRVMVSTLGTGLETIWIDDGNGDWREYAFEILGFEQGDQMVDTFWTKEKADNSGYLYAQFTYAENINTDPGPSPVPLPAAGFLMLGGLAALGAASRRRKAA